MEKGMATTVESPRMRWLARMRLPEAPTRVVGRKFFRFVLTVQGLGAFALITLAVLLRKAGTARRVLWPAIVTETARAGVRLLPMFFLVALGLGLVIIGQSVSWLTRVGAIDYLGSIMVVVLVRELGPLVTALLVLARVGTAHVVELGTARALGEVEALEALGIDPVHYIVVPRVVAMSVSVFALTIYLIGGALLSGYLWAFLQDVPLTPGDYFRQLAGALGMIDFVLLAFKTLAFGFVIAVVTCYHGLAQPLRLEEVSGATVRAVAQSVVGCIGIDAVVIILYLAS